tara:strand:+ start:39087 stop:40304 length:1218 start_codon:yes stop_codon:yes gene_type:complete
MKSIFYTLLSLIAINFNLNSQTTTINDGNWSTAGNWDNGVPGNGTTASITNNMNLNTNLSIGNGGNYTINGGSITDLVGGPQYSISINGSGIVVVDGNVTIEGNLSLSNNSSLTIKGCDTLRVRGDASFVNNSIISIEACAVLIIEGDVNMNNNNTNNIDGNMVVGGSLRATNNALISGNGNIQIDGEVDLNNSSSIFGSTTGCAGTCSYGIGAGLPIELTYFDAELTKNGLIEVNWETTAEINNDYFTIELSTNGVDYNSVEEVLGAGNSISKLKYRAQINPLNAEINYIRLKQTDFNGEHEYFRPVAVTTKYEELKKESTFSIYPNPGNGVNLNVEFSAAHSSEYTVEVMDSKGSIVASKRIFNQEGFAERFELLNGIQLNTGVYFVRAYNEKETLSTKYIVQ